MIKHRSPDLTGQIFGRLIVIGRAKPRGTNPYWECRCDCGVTIESLQHRLKTGRTKSCGCLKAELLSAYSYRHGDARRGNASPEYGAWAEMIQRCTNPKQKRYADYGGRGIHVCERWLNGFENFLADMGRRPTSEHSIDRYPNNDGNYEKTNCRWATRLEQAANKRVRKDARIPMRV